MCSSDLLPGDVRLVAADVAGGTSEFARGVLVRLDTSMTPALAAEGLCREWVHALQALRKAKGLRVTDRVRVAWKADGDLAAAIRAHVDYASEEVLAVSFVEAPSLDGAGAETVDVCGAKALVRLDPAR